jgi:hypothetical protein
MLCRFNNTSSLSPSLSKWSLWSLERPDSLLFVVFPVSRDDINRFESKAASVPLATDALLRNSLPQGTQSYFRRSQMRRFASPSRTTSWMTFCRGKDGSLSRRGTYTAGMNCV